MPGGISMEGVSNLSPEFQKAYASAVQAERKPLQQMENRKGNMEAKVTLLNDLVSKVDGLKKALPSLGSPFAIRELAFSSDDLKVVSGSADKSVADPGKHNLEILQLAGNASALSNSLPDKDETQMGTGYITFTTLTGDTKEIFIDNDNSTLEGMAKVINSAKMGIKAAAINDGTDPEVPFRLLLSVEGVGAGQDVNFPEFYFSGGEEDFYLESKKDANNAIVRFQGFEIQSPTNEMKDIIPGVTLNLKGLTDTGKPTTVTIDQDIPKTTTKVKDVVDKLNQVFSFIQAQNTMDDKTDTSKTLGGDYGIRLAENRLRTSLQQTFLTDGTRAVRSLNDLGIQFNKNGTLNFDEAKFQHILESNFDEVVDFMAGDGISTGVITALNQAVGTISGAGVGLLTNQQQTYNSQLRKIGTDIAAKEKQSERKAETLKNQLAKAQSALATLQGQQSYMQSALGSGQLMPGMGGG